MENLREENRVRLCGTVGEEPVFSHSSRSEIFYTFPLEAARLSGAVDRVNVILREGQLREQPLQPGDRVTVLGELRSFNNKSGVGSRLVITVFVRELCPGEAEDENRVFLTGTLCRKPALRETPMGRDICDLMLAVNRPYGRSDYLPCIAWGQRAREASLWEVGTALCLEGRLQSRKYIKCVEGEAVEKTAFEVSVTDLSPAEA